MSSGGVYGAEGKITGVLYIFALVLIILFGLIGNITICYAVFKRESLRKPCFYILCNNAIGDCIRVAVIFPIVILTIWSGDWTYGKFVCDMMAFMNIYLYYGGLYTTAFLSAERYVMVRCHRFHRQKITGLACLLGVLSIWAMAIATAFPPIFNASAYDFATAEFQCTFARRRNTDGLSETGYYATFFVVINSLTVLFYMRTFLFMRTHRKMRPLQFVPAISNSWTFYGPGSTGQAATNWFLGFRQSTTPPPLVAQAPPANRANLALSNHNFHEEERLTKLFLLIAVVDVLLWLPYVFYCFTLAFGLVHWTTSVVTNFTWLSYLQTCATPLICIIAVPEVRTFCCSCLRRRRKLPQSRAEEAMEIRPTA